MKYTINQRAKDLEKRRLKAGEYFSKGKTQAWIAYKLEVTPAAVCKWHILWKQSKEKGLKSKGNCGAKSLITEYKLKKVIKVLEKGPIKFGFPNDLWTLERVAKVFKRITGVDYHIGHMWKILTDTLGWSNQKPNRRARERNGSAIAKWVKKDWPTIKKKP